MLIIFVSLSIIQLRALDEPSQNSGAAVLNPDTVLSSLFLPRFIHSGDFRGAEGADRAAQLSCQLGIE